ncbi:YfiR family protein [Thiolapillus sp.]
MTGWPGVARLLLILLMLLPATIGSAALVSSEYRLKAALIYKLTRFVEWPDAKNQTEEDFGICILGRDDFGGALDALEKRTVNEHPIRIHRFVQSEAVDARCQILFISESKRPFLRKILRFVSQYPVLTISDMEGFARRGGMIEFTQGEKRIGFRINLGQAVSAGLKIAAPLLDLAAIIETEQP